MIIIRHSQPHWPPTARNGFERHQNVEYVNKPTLFLDASASRLASRDARFVVTAWPHTDTHWLFAVETTQKTRSVPVTGTELRTGHCAIPRRVKRSRWAEREKALLVNVSVSSDTTQVDRRPLVVALLRYNNTLLLLPLINSPIDRLVTVQSTGLVFR